MNGSTLASTLLAAAAVSFANADELVKFDVPLVAAATPAAETTVLGGDVVEVRFQITALFDNDVKGVHEIVYTILSPDQTLSVLDFEPKQELFSLIDGPIEVESTSGVNQSFDATLSATSPLPLGPVSGQAVLGTNANRSEQASQTQRYTELAPKQLILAAGTVRRGTGVFFKLRPWAQGALEGRKEFVVRFVAPKGWRNGQVVFRGEATVARRGPLGEEKSIRGADHVVGLYLEDDAEARRTAWEVASKTLAPLGAEKRRRSPRLFTPPPTAALFRSTRGVVQDVGVAALKPVVFWTDSLKIGPKGESR